MISGNKYPEAAAGQTVQARKLDITLRENINAQIERLTEHLKELQDTRDRLEKIGILDMRIDDVQRAMSW